MTVKRLIEELQKIDNQDAELFCESEDDTFDIRSVEDMGDSICIHLDRE